MLRHFPCSLGWQGTVWGCICHLYSLISPSSHCLQSLVRCLCWERSWKELLTPADSTLARNSQLIFCFSEIQRPRWTLRFLSADSAKDDTWCCFFHSVHLQLQMRAAHLESPCVLSSSQERDCGFLGCGENCWHVDGQRRCKMTTCSSLTLLWLCLVALGMQGKSVIWLHRGLIALYVSNLISYRHLPTPELLFCILKPSDLKQRTQFYFAGLLHHLNWSLKCLKHFRTNFLCLKLIWTPGGVNFSWLSAGDLLKSCQKSQLPEGWDYLPACLDQNDLYVSQRSWELNWKSLGD